MSPRQIDATALYADSLPPLAVVEGKIADLRVLIARHLRETVPNYDGKQIETHRWREMVKHDEELQRLMQRAAELDLLRHIVDGGAV